MLKKPSVAFRATPLARRDSLVAHISNGVQPFEMAARPWAARRLPKNSVFGSLLEQHADPQIQVTGRVPVPVGSPRLQVSVLDREQ